MSMSPRERVAWLVTAGATGAAIWFNSRNESALDVQAPPASDAHAVYALPPAEESEATAHDESGHDLALHHEAGW